MFHTGDMRSLLTLALAAVALLVAGASPAAAKIVELGESATPPVPSCPAKPCFAVSRTTGYQAKVGEQRGMYTVPENGRIVAWSIRLADPGARQTSFFEKQFGGAASAQITILRPGRKLYARTVASSPVQRLGDYFGETVQFPLERSLDVRKGWIVALTVPTWAPALSVGFGNDVSWRAASKADAKCTDLETQSPQGATNRLARYRCLFRTARLTYTATLITSPARR